MRQDAGSDNLASLQDTTLPASRLALFTLLLVALALRLPLLPFAVHLPGNYSDIEVWKSWAKTIHESGLVNVFQATEINYVGYNYFLWFVGEVYALFSPAFDASSLWLNALVKVAPVAFDLLLVWLTYIVARRIVTAHPADMSIGARRSLPFVAAGAVAFHPAIIYDSAAWSQTDSIITFFMLAAVFLVASGRPGAGLFMWGIGFVVKPHPVVILPLLVAYVWWSGGVRGILRAGAGATGAILLMLGYWLVNGKGGDLIDVYRTLATPDSVLTMQAWNLWWIPEVGHGAAPDDAFLLIGPLTVSYKTASTLLLAAAALLAVAYLRRQRDLVGLLEASAFMAFAFYLLHITAHERYLYPFFPLLVPVLLVRRGWLFLWVPLSLTFFLNLYIVAPLDEVLPGRYLYSDLTTWTAAFHAFAFMMLAGRFAWVAFSPPATVAVPRQVFGRLWLRRPSAQQSPQPQR